MPKLDALCIPAVLETVLDHLDSKHVAVCRLVNTTWNGAAVKILQNRLEIAFHSLEHMRRFNETFSMPITNISVKFHSFHFASALFTNAVQDIAFGALRRLQEEIQTFVKLMGHQVTQLRLVIRPILEIPCSCGGGEDAAFTTVMFMESLKMIYNYFPNLQNLKLLFITPSTSSAEAINSVDFDTTRLMDGYGGNSLLPNLTSVQIDVEIGPQQQQSLLQILLNEAVEQQDDELVEEKMISWFIKLLLTTSPNLRFISCSNQAPPALLEQSIFQSFPSKSSSSLERINTRLTISSNAILSLCSHPFSNLDTANFEISSDIAEETMPLLKDLFVRLRGTLHNLTLSFQKNSKHIFEPFPLNVLMKKLKHLTMEQFEGCINFSKLPALEKLTFKRCRLNGIVQSVMNTSLPNYYSSLNSLEIIERTVDEKEDSPRLFIELATCIFPQLNLLTLAKLSFTVPIQRIFSQCQQLKRLTILKCDGVTDSMLCGVRNSLINWACPMEPIVQNIGEDTKGEAVFQKMVTMAKNPSQAAMREHPFIGDLKQLQFLTLEGDFSDIAVLYGVILCDKLTRLNLRSDMCTWRSPRIVRLALERLISASINGTKLKICD